MTFGLLPTQVALIGVVAGWLLTLSVGLIIWWRTPREASSRGARSRDGRALYGFIGQLAAFLGVWLWRRPAGTDLIPVSHDVSWALAGLAILLSGLGAALAVSAMLSLGRTWPIGARVADDQPLATKGAFGLVRHPMYLAGFMLLVATGLAWSPIEALLVGGWVYAVSTHIRASREEKLLSSGVGTAYSVYSNRHPRFFPRIWTTSPHPVDREAAFASLYLAAFLVYLFFYQEGGWLHWVTMVILPVLALPLVGLYRSRRAVVESLGLSKERARRGLWLALGIGLAVIAVQLMDRSQRDEVLRIISAPRGFLMPLAAIGLLVITVATTEEVFFRGLIQTRLSYRLHSDLAGWVLASLAFAVYTFVYAYRDADFPSAGHLGAAVRATMTTGLGAGLVVGFVYWKTGRNLIAAILLHALINVVPVTRVVSRLLQ